MRTILSAITVLVVGMLLAACAPSGPVASPSAPPAASAVPTSAATPAPAVAAPIQLRAAYSAVSGAMAPAWFAADGGYFGQRGLDVDLRYIPSAAVLTPALLAGE